MQHGRWNLNKKFRGDEFAIIMVEMTSDLSYTISEKITEINQQIAIAGENTPAVSISVGVAFTNRENPGKTLFTDADLALYYTKLNRQKWLYLLSSSLDME